MCNVRLCLAWLAACSSSPSAKPAGNNPPAGSAQARDAAALWARAQKVLASDAPSRFDLPNGDPPRRREASEALAVACQAGHRRSCWYLLHVAASDDGVATAFRQIVDACEHGEVWSCRALPRGSRPQVPRGLPGEQGRTGCRDATTDCDPLLTAECRHGFPLSCEVLATRTSDASERDQLVARAGELAREGCRLGIINECEAVAIAWPEPDRRAAYEQLCAVQRSECDRLGALLEDEGHRDAARAEYERACQYGFVRPGNCLELARRYLARELPEPVPGRGQALVRFACAALDASERDDEAECKARPK